MKKNCHNCIHFGFIEVTTYLGSKHNTEHIDSCNKKELIGTQRMIMLESMANDEYLEKAKKCFETNMQYELGLACDNLGL